MHYIPRKLLFKAWNKETKLLMRLNNIECVKGELFKTNHILLQFTGFYDKQEEEIYEMDVILIGSDKFIVLWDPAENRWGMSKIPDIKTPEPFKLNRAKAAMRLCSYFESEIPG
jgi:hypothetical protein